MNTGSMGSILYFRETEKGWASFLQTSRAFKSKAIVALATEFFPGESWGLRKYSAGLQKIHALPYPRF
jgi:hypothetical protein